MTDVPSLEVDALKKWDEDIERTLSAEDLEKLSPLCTYREVNITQPEAERGEARPPSPLPLNLGESISNNNDAKNVNGHHHHKKKKRSKHGSGDGASVVEDGILLARTKKNGLSNSSEGIKKKEKKDRKPYGEERRRKSGGSMIVFGSGSGRKDKEKDNKENKDSKDVMDKREEFLERRKKKLEERKRERERERERNKEREEDTSNKEKLINSKCKSDDFEKRDKNKKEKEKKEKEKKKEREREKANTKKLDSSAAAAAKKKPPPLPPGALAAANAAVNNNSGGEAAIDSPNSNPKEKKRRFYSLATRRKHRRSASYPAIPLDNLTGISPQSGDSTTDGDALSPRRRIVSMSIDMSPRTARAQSTTVLEGNNHHNNNDHNTPHHSAPEVGGFTRSRSKTIATLQKFGATIRVGKRKNSKGPETLGSMLEGGDWTDLELVSPLTSPTTPNSQSARKPSQQSERRKAERLEIIREIENTQFDIKKLLKLLVQPDLVLAKAMCDSLPRTNREVAMSTIVGFYLRHSLCIPLLIKLVHEEVMATYDASTLFRSNNVTSSLLSLHAKYGARNYLRHTLEPIVKEVCTCGLHFELDPTKLEIRGIVDQDTQQNSLNVVGIADKCLASIRNSLPYCPMPVRKMCKTLQLAVAEKFPQSTEAVVGGYYFLRFICPALVSPDVYGVLSEGTTITPQDRRALLLVSKTLQQLANGVPFGAKETYMTLMNPFIETHQEYISSLFAELAEIPLESKEDLLEEEQHKEADAEEEENYRIFFYTFFRDNLPAVEEKLAAILSEQQQQQQTKSTTTEEEAAEEGEKEKEAKEEKDKTEKMDNEIIRQLKELYHL